MSKNSIEIGIRMKTDELERSVNAIVSALSHNIDFQKTLGKPVQEVQAELKSLSASVGDLSNRISALDTVNFAKLESQFASFETKLSSITESIQKAGLTITDLNGANININTQALDDVVSKLTSITEKIGQFRKPYKELIELIGTASGGGTLGVNTTKIGDTSKAIKQAEQAVNEYTRLRDKIEVDSAEQVSLVDESSIKSLETAAIKFENLFNQITEVDMQAEKLRTTLEKTTDPASAARLEQELKQVESQYSTLLQEALKYYQIIGSGTSAIESTSEKNRPVISFDTEEMMGTLEQFEEYYSEFYDRLIAKARAKQSQVEATTAEVSNVLVNLQDGSIRVPVEIAATAEDLSNQAVDMILQANKNIVNKNIKLQVAVEPKVGYQDRNAVAKDVTQQYQDVLKSAGSSAAKESHAIEQIPETFRDLLNALSSAKHSLDTLNTTAVAQLSAAFESMSFTAPLVSDAFQSIKDNVDNANYTNVVNALTKIQELIQDITNLNKNLKDAALNSQWENIAKVYDQLMPAKSNGQRAIVNNKALRSQLESQLISMYSDYKDFGGENFLTQLSRTNQKRLHNYEKQAALLSGVAGTSNATPPGTLFGQMTTEITAIVTGGKELSGVLTEIQNHLLGINGIQKTIDISNIISQIQNLTQELKNCSTIMQQVTQQYNASPVVKNIKTSLAGQNRAFNSAQKSLSNAAVFNGLDFRGLIDTSAYSDTAAQRINELIAAYQKAEQSLAQIQASGTLKTGTMSEDQFKSLIGDVEKYVQLLKTSKKLLGEQGLQTNTKGTLFGQAGDVKSIDEARQAITDLLATQQKVSGQFSKNGAQWTGSYKDINGEIHNIVISYDELNQQLRIADNGIKQSGGALGDYNDLLTSNAQQLLQMAVYAVSFRRALSMLTGTIREGWGVLKDYDAALTNIKYTMDLTESEFNALGQSTIQMARELKVSIEDAMQISQIYANMKTTPEEILTIARPTAVLSNLASISTEEASNEIQSVMQQFQLAQDQADHIVDVYDKISASIKMDYAKGIANIAKGVEAAGTVAYDAGLSFEQLASIIAKTAERTREEGGSIGQALKTITVRLSKASKLSGADEVDNSQLSDASKALHEIGIEVYQANGEFNQLDTILDQLAQKWDTLSDAQQANISYTVAATRQTNKFRAILQSWADSQQLAAEATDATGNAMANQEKYADSLKGRLQSIDTEMDAFWLSVLNSEAIKVGVSGIQLLTEGLNKLSETIGPSLTGGLVVSAGVTGSLFASSFLQSLSKSLASQGAAATISKGLSALLKPGIIAPALAVAGTIAAVSAYNAWQEELKAKASRDAQSVQEQLSGIDEYIKKIEAAREIVDSNLSTEQERTQAKSELYDIQKQLNEIYGEEAGALDLVNGKLSEQKEIIEGLTTSSLDKWATGTTEAFKLFGITIKEGESNLNYGLRQAEYLTSREGTRFKFQSNLDEESYQKLNEKVSSLGLTLDKMVNLPGRGNDLKDYYAIDTAGLTPEEAQAALQELAEYVAQLSGDASGETQEAISSFHDGVSRGIQDIVTAINNATDPARSALLYQLQQKANAGDSTGLDLYRDYEKAEADWRRAVLGSDDQTVLDTAERLRDVYGQIELYLTDSADAAANLAEYGQKVNEQFGYGTLGNVDSTRHERYTTGQQMINAGWSPDEINPDDKLTLYNTGYDVRDAKGGYAVEFTPIFVGPNGEKTILTADALDDYVDRVTDDAMRLASKEGRSEINYNDILEADAQNFGLLVTGNPQRIDAADEAGWEDAWAYIEGVEEGVQDNKDHMMGAIEGVLGGGNQGQFAPLFEMSGFEDATSLKRLFEAEAKTVDSELYDALKTAKGAGLDIYDLVSDTFDSSELPEHVRQALQTIHDYADYAKMGTDDLRSSLEDVGYASQQLNKVDTSNVLNFTDTQGEIDKLQSIVNTVTSTIEKLNDTGLDNAGLSSIFGAFNQSGLSNMSGWMEQLNSARGSATATKQVLSDMLTTLVSEKNYVTEDAASYQYLQQALQEMGFTMGTLSAQQKEFLDEQMASVEATIQQAAEQGNLEEVMRTTVASEISGLQQVAEQLGITSGEWLSYFYTKMSNNSAINVSGDLHNLMLIIGMLDNAQLAWIKYYQARADMLKSASKTATSVSAGTPLTGEQQNSLKGGLMAAADSHTAQAVSSIGSFNAELARLQGGFTQKTDNIKSSIQAVDSGVLKTTDDVRQLNNVLAQGQADNEALGLQKTEDFLKSFNVAEGNGAASWEPPASTGGKSGGGGGGGDKSQKDESKEFIDWYQRRIDVMEKYHTELQKISSNEQKSYGERRKALQEQITQDSQVLEVYKAQAKAYENVYQNSVNSLKKLADESGKIQVQKFDENGELQKAEYTIEEIIDLVQNGGLDAAQFTGDTAKAVQEVISGYDDWLKILQLISDKQKEMGNHSREQLDLEIDRLDAMQSYIAAVGSVIQSEMDYANATGQIISVGMYQGLIDNVDRQMDVLEDKISEYSAYLNSGDVTPDSAEYYEILTALTECNNELIQCSIKQAEWNEAIKDIPINLIKKYINEINRIKADVQNFMSEEDSVEIAHNYEEYSKLIELNQENIKKQLEEIELLRDKLADYEWGSEKYEETAAEIQTVEDEVSNLIQEMNEFHKAILNLPIEKFAEINEQLQSMISAMNDIKSEYDQVIDAVVEEIEKHSELLEKEQEQMEDDYDKRIQAIQDEIDALDKENEVRQKQMALEQAEAAMRKANSQKTVAIIRDGLLTYEQDVEAIRKAQEELDEANYQYRIYELQKQIEDLEDEKDKLTKNYEDQIDNLDKISNKWSEIVSNIEHAKDALVATNVLGNGWVAKVTSGNDDDIYQMFKRLYESLDKDITTYQDQVDSNERVSALMTQVVDAYLAGNLSYDQATTAMRGVVNELNSPDGMTATENMKKLQSFFGDLFDTNGSVADILKAMNSAAQQEAGNYDNYFKVVQDNINLMNEYTTTWDELRKSVDEQIEALKAAYEAAKEAAMRMKDYASYYYDGGGDSGGGNIYVQGDYVIAGADRVYYDPGGHTGSFTHGEGIYSPGDMISYHEGIENGLVGPAASDKKYRMLQEMSLKRLKPNEIPALLKTGEAVLNGQQQATLLGNMRQLAKQQMIPQVTGNQGVQVNLTMSNLTFHEINNGQDFANYITNNLSSAIAQGLARG